MPNSILVGCNSSPHYRKKRDLHQLGLSSSRYHLIVVNLVASSRPGGVARLRRLIRTVRPSTSLASPLPPTGKACESTRSGCRPLREGCYLDDLALILGVVPAEGFVLK
jgi:hypothetical protein